MGPGSASGLARRSMRSGEARGNVDSGPEWRGEESAKAINEWIGGADDVNVASEG